MLLKLLRFWLPVVLYAGLIFAVSSIHGEDTPAGWPHVDKIIHIGVYSVLGWLLMRALLGTLPQPNKYTLLIAISLAIFYGITDEYHQSFVPGRSADMLDLIADGVGGTIGGWCYRIFRKKE